MSDDRANAAASPPTARGGAKLGEEIEPDVLNLIPTEIESEAEVPEAQEQAPATKEFPPRPNREAFRQRALPHLAGYTTTAHSPPAVSPDIGLRRSPRGGDPSPNVTEGTIIKGNELRPISSDGSAAGRIWQSICNQRDASRLFAGLLLPRDGQSQKAARERVFRIGKNFGWDISLMFAEFDRRGAAKQADSFAMLPTTPLTAQDFLEIERRAKKVAELRTPGLG